MPPTTNHDQWMRKVCGVCLRKQKEKNERDFQQINDEVLNLIKDHGRQPNYDLDINPRVCCKSCVVTLRHIAKNGLNAGRSLPNVQYDKLKLPVVTRQQSGRCSCTYCCVGRLNGQQYHNFCKDVRKGVGKLPSDPESTSSNGDSPDVAVICQKCQGIILVFRF